jgi:ribonuclease D
MLSISKQQLVELPEVKYPGKVILVDSAAKSRSALTYLRKVEQVGFDTETRPSFQKFRHYNVSLAQISAGDECFLFRLKLIGSIEPFMEFLGLEEVQKIGLSLKDDFHSLAKLMAFEPRGFVELQSFVKQYQIADNSLQKIYGIIFNQRISKNQRLTNWEAPELTESQQHYAAIDAWACQRIYNHLIAGNFSPEQSIYTIDEATDSPAN